MLNSPVTSLWINVAWLSLQCTGARLIAWEEAFDDAHARAIENLALVDWLTQTFDFDREGSYLEVGDRSSPQMRLTRRGCEVAYKIPVARLEQSDDLAAEFDAIIREIFEFWAQKKNVSPPPL